MTIASLEELHLQQKKSILDQNFTEEEQDYDYKIKSVCKIRNNNRWLRNRSSRIYLEQLIGDTK